MPKWDERLRYLKFTRKLQQAFLEDVSALVEDGVPAGQAIETIRTISEGVTKEVATQIAVAIAEGKLLADGMQGWFSRPLIEVIRAGEDSGALPGALRAATTFFLQQTNAIGALLNALVYPAVVLVVALIMVVFIKNSVLETFAKIKPIIQWPDIGQSLYHLATLTQNWWWLFLIIVAGMIYGLMRMLQGLTGKTRNVIDEIPLLSLYRQITAARFMETLGLLISNGVVLKKALTIMHRDAPPYLSWHILKMQYQLSGGKDNIADVLDTHLISSSDLIRLRIVAKAKGFAPALVSLGQQSNRRNAKAITLGGKITGGVVLALGAFLAATMVLGIYSIGSMVAT